MKVIIECDKEFIEAFKVIKTERVKIEGNKIIIEHKDISKLRAVVNLILRCAKIYEDFNLLLSQQ